MPDKRQHRGRHPADLDAFSPEAQSRLRAAVGDLSWLLSHGYAEKSSLKLVGDRYNLQERQRIAVMRSACSDAALARRHEHEVHAPQLVTQPLLIDGYNVLTTIEAALAQGVVIVGRDGCYRDMASMHGTFRQVSETLPAIQILGNYLSTLNAQEITWYLDRPVSNSGRLKTALLEAAAANGWTWDVQVVTNPDTVLSDSAAPVATADSVILDHCKTWFGLARAVLESKIPHAFVVHMA